MKVRSHILGLIVAAAVFVPSAFSQENPSGTNASAGVVAEAAEVSATGEVVAVEGVSNTAAPVVVTVEGMDELRQQLDEVKRANEAASARWIVLSEQNMSLSNVLSGLQDTLVSQKQKETEITQQARAFNIAVLTAAGSGIFLVLLASYWFQLRCMNRVMEVVRTHHQLPAVQSADPGMLEWASARESRLLDAVKVLENRVKQLEAPSAASSAVQPAAPAPATVTASENGHASEVAVKLIEVGPPEPSSTSSKASLLMAKGEILLDMERWQEAVTTFQEALALDPRNAEAHLKKGIALERLNRLEQSLSSYEEAVRLNPNRAFAHVYKARVLAALHRYDEALSVYDSALGKNGPKIETARVNGR